MAKRRTGQATLFGPDQDVQPEARREPPPSAKLHCEVALNRPVRQTFTYAVPDELVERVRRGVRVYVPFGSTKQVGVVVDTRREADLGTKRVRAVAGVLDEEPGVSEALLALTLWIAERYACAWGEALAAVLPAPLKRSGGIRKQLVLQVIEDVGEEALADLAEAFPKQHRLLRTLLEMGGRAEMRDLLRQLQLSESPARSLERRGWLRVERVDAEPDPLSVTESIARPRPDPNSDQERAIDVLRRRLDARESASFLLHGITGSGKTEVYLRAIEHALTLGRSAIVLVPEISLTPQTVSWFRSRFGEVAVLHSRLTDSQRLAAWKRLARGDVSVVVGARSAIFAPLPDLGVIVVDEEHEPSFKQGSTPRYHARDVALERARLEGAVCILGSATPSLESWFAAKAGTLEKLQLSKRVGGGTQPHIDVVDMRLESERSHDAPLFSRLLRHLLQETLDAGEQAILFLNRRGFVPILWCSGCRETLRCEQCDLALTFHRRIQRLVCHGCCEERRLPKVCPLCTAPGLRPFGVGSERVEADCKRLFPEATVRRMDSDTMRRRTDYEETLGDFGARKIDVLVGTQMIAKGLDFPNVTLVGVVSADAALHLPDFRASERTFQLIAQVAGRAGRSHLPGRIVVQTMAPAHPAVRLAAENDFEGFVQQESSERSELGYPPHGRLARALFEHRDERRVVEAARHYADLLRREAAGIAVLGPAPAPIAVLRGRHRAHFLIKAPADGATLQRATALLVDSPVPKGLFAPKIDVDAVAML